MPANSQLIFELIKQQTPPHISPAQQIALLLHITSDTVYRLIRGERELSLSELAILLKHYPIALENVIELPKNKILLEAIESSTDSTDFYAFLESIYQYLFLLGSMPNVRLNYLCKDLNFFQFFSFPALAALKMFFWNKTIKNRPKYADKKFNWLSDDSEPSLLLSKKILDIYCQIPSVEIFSMEVINSTLYQIQFYKKRNFFETPRPTFGGYPIVKAMHTPY